jgi:hypothetical protein
MSRLFAALICGICFCSIASVAPVASAQVIFQPLQYQYGTNSMFYYGGSDPRMIARGLADDKGRCGMPGYSADAPTRIYCDCMPGLNARVYGMTVADAANQASMNAPRYFRKRDLLAAAVPQSDGSFVVPAQAQPVRGTIVIKPSHAMHPVHPSTQPTQPTSAPGPVIIFPKELLDRPLHPKSDPVTLAQ